MLHLPPSISVQKFVGGYKAVSDYTDLTDTETNDAQNVYYGPNANIDQRLGSLRLYGLRLYNTSTLSATTFSAGAPITGHYYFKKIGSTSAFHVVAAGDAIYNYSSATASPILTGLSANSNNFFTFAQLQDPNSAGDDMVIMANGVDRIFTWTGSATAVALSTLTSASSVPIGKFLVAHKERLYVLGIVDSTDADAGNKVAYSGFNSTGGATPHIFSTANGGGSFYVATGGKQGTIQGSRILNDQLCIFTRKSTWKFNPGSGNFIDTSSLYEMEESQGILAPFSLVDAGSFLIFLSEQGVYAFDGVNFVHISEKVDEDLFRNSSLGQLQYAKGVYYKRDNQYRLYYPETGSNRNNRCLIYDLRPTMKCWQPPVTGRQVSFVSTFDTSDGIEEILYGDYVGYLYRDNTGNNDGLTTGFNGSVSSATVTTLTETTASFTTSGEGLSGHMVTIYQGTGEGQSRLITTNTADTLTLETGWNQTPDTTSRYQIAGINAFWRSKDFSFGNEDLVKLFRHIRIRPREEGSINLTVHYIVDFKQLAQATSRDISLLDGGWAWGTAVWGRDRWGAKSTILRKISLRNTSAQTLIGTHLAVRFSNLRANETFRVVGFDVEFKPGYGKR